ncbi:hypothetical protein BZA05DRAFT_235054 [Tricharina praecox]|uniref:uncharacterized protein n=1 Tax=Tricharina praecox TaxID=43433 RepID=UPI002220DBD4|nr:uncharacterized protein BZA05DRAFT_235054 [Tricharina praecox]KAI5855250.1 hypothetical protein BZA05DRAFT_235054 [Tricharina praecox]
MQFTLSTLLVAAVAFIGLTMAAPIGKLAARQVITFGDDGVPSMSGAGGASPRSGWVFFLLPIFSFFASLGWLDATIRFFDLLLHSMAGSLGFFLLFFCPAVPVALLTPCDRFGPRGFLLFPLFLISSNGSLGPAGFFFFFFLFFLGGGEGGCFYSVG